MESQILGINIEMKEKVMVLAFAIERDRSRLSHLAVFIIVLSECCTDCLTWCHLDHIIIILPFIIHTVVYSLFISWFVFSAFS